MSGWTRPKRRPRNSSNDLPAAGLTFTWSPDGTTLTIDPRADLIYQADTVPSAAQPKSYAFSIATSAADAAGNTLAMPFTSRFSTLRRIVHKLNSQSYEISENATGTYVEACSFMIVGAHMGYWFGGLVEFDLSILPAEVQLFEKGQLDAMQYFGTQGTADYPFGTDRLGVIVCDHTVYNPPTSAKLTGGAVRRLGTLSSGAGEGPQSLDIVNAVREDYEQRAARRNRTQYRIAFTIQNPNYQNAQNNAIFDCTPSALTLTLTYLAP